MLQGVATINYWADDVEAAKRWYAELLGLQPYFDRRGPDGRVAYAEFRIGDYQHELGLVDRRWAPPGATTETGGATMYWHVDDVAESFERLLALGATEYEPITPAGDAGFVTAAVVDPFGNVLGWLRLDGVPAPGSGPDRGAACTLGGAHVQVRR